MKYFTPELLERYGSKDDAIADSAAQEWEERSRVYQEELRTLKPKLSKPLREFLRYDMHDARLVTFSFGDNKRIVSFLFQLAGVGSRSLQLTYWLSGRSEFLVPQQTHNIEVEWLYDELDIVEGGRRRVFKHSILMTAGVELQLEFEKFEFLPYKTVVANVPMNIRFLQTEGNALAIT